jgi:transposase InsO family protein
MSLQGSMTVERMCELGPVSRAGFYRFLQEERPIEEEMEVRSAIQQIAVGHRRRYGYRRIAAELRRRGMRVNHKRVLRIMRKDNLLAVNRRRFVVTTDSNHTVEVYLNLASRMRLTGIDQLWVADITYRDHTGNLYPHRATAGSRQQCARPRLNPCFARLLIRTWLRARCLPISFPLNSHSMQEPTFPVSF